MESLKIERTKTTPRIDFDVKFHTLALTGDVYPENADKFFNPILDWLNKYLSSLHHKCIVSFHLSYFNTASSGRISAILEVLEKFYKKGKEISIHWYFDPDHEEMQDVAEEFREEITIPFQIIEKKL
jgi:SiaC family regulatory phosphoprotein